jgi:DNA integrity scanning protein DisA with diadenylate cyclase activity
MLFKGKGGVWDAKQSKMLCEFVDGKFETDDKYIIDELIAISKRDGSVILQESEYEEYAKELPFVPDKELMNTPPENITVAKKQGRPKGVK